MVLIGTSIGRAGSPRHFVEKVEATSGSDGLQVEVTTTSSAAPTFSVFPLREPDRLVMDIADFVWKPGLTAHLPSGTSAIQGIRIGQVTADPPVTRLVFDLSAPAKPFRYRAVSSTANGNLRVELSDQLGAAQESDGWLSIRSASPALTRKAVSSAPTAETRPPASRETRPPDARQTEKTEPPAAVPTSSIAPAAAAPEIASMAGGEQSPAVAESVPSPRPAVVRPSTHASSPTLRRPSLSSAWDDPAIRIAAALAVIALTGIAAIWARYRFQLSRRPAPEAESDAQPVLDPEAIPPTEGRQSDLIQCKVVDGYLVLAPEGGAPIVGGQAGTTRARVDRGTLALDFSGAMAEPRQSNADDAPDAATRVRDLVASLADDSIAVRRAAAEGLLEIAAAGHWSALPPYLQSGDPKVRSVVAGILGDAGAVDCLSEVAGLSEDPDPSVRACVMYAFAQYGESAARYASSVRARLSDTESAVRAGAVEALAALAPRSEDTAEEIIHFTADPDPLVRQAASSATFGFALRGVARPLIDLLGDFTRRAQALEVLQQADDAVLWRLLVAGRTSASASTQAALDTLSYVMSRRWTADDFKEEIESSDTEARLTGIEGLSMVGGPEAIRCIRRLAEADPSAEVRRRASEVLTQWQGWAGSEAPAGAETEGLRTEA